MSESTPKSASGARPVALRFSQVSFSYSSVPVLSNANFHVHEGEFVALVGPNGAGKTTVIRLLLGLAKPETGSVEILGAAPEEARNSIGYVPQNATFDPAFPIAVKEVVRMGRLRGRTRRFSAEDAQAVNNALELTDLTDLANRSYAALSGGQRRRVLVARALAAQPRVLILDEPTANMDADSEARLFKALGDLKGSTTIIVVTHDSGFVSALTDVILCVGENTEGKSLGKGGHSIVRHRSEPADHAPPDLYGGDALKVLHDTRVAADQCCGGREEGSAS